MWNSSKEVFNNIKNLLEGSSVKKNILDSIDIKIQPDEAKIIIDDMNESLRRLYGDQTAPWDNNQFRSENENVLIAGTFIHYDPVKQVIKCNKDDKSITIWGTEDVFILADKLTREYNENADLFIETYQADLFFILQCLKLEAVEKQSNLQKDEEDSFKTHIVDGDLDEMNRTLTTILPDMQIKNSILFIKEEEIHHPIITIMLEAFVNERVDIFTSIAKFIYRLYNHDVRNMFEEVANFVHTYHMPISADGDIIGLKSVNSNFTSPHDGITLNLPGTLVSVANVDYNKQRSCSQGLHVGSAYYIKKFSGTKYLAVSIQPEDVLAVPASSDGGKMRCKQYFVLGVVNTDIINNYESRYAKFSPTDLSSIEALGIIQSSYYTTKENPSNNESDESTETATLQHTKEVFNNNRKLTFTKDELYAVLNKMIVYKGNIDDVVSSIHNTLFNTALSEYYKNQNVRASLITQLKSIFKLKVIQTENGICSIGMPISITYCQKHAKDIPYILIALESLLPNGSDIQTMGKGVIFLSLIEFGNVDDEHYLQFGSEHISSMSLNEYSHCVHTINVHIKENQGTNSNRHIDDFDSKVFATDHLINYFDNQVPNNEKDANHE